MAQKNIPINIEDIMHTAYLQYALSVNIGRAIPDVRDGLKPGNRRILYAMRQLGLTNGRAYTKCAKVVGEVIGNYHPHGDQSIYDTLVRMAQDFSMSHPLVDGQGNFGSIDGDAPAAYRYTECRMTKLTEELLTDLDRDTVDTIPNFDESLMEPTVLPAGFPNLLVNGSTGIGVGMATNIPPHNLGEVISGVVHLIENPDATARELMQYIQGPDFPTSAMIMGIQPIIDLYEHGHGIITVRARCAIEESKSDRNKIITTELPYAVNKEALIKKIAELVNAKVIPGISGINDESSSRTGIRVVIELKMNAHPEVVLNQLYKHTALQSSYGTSFLVVDNQKPVTMNLPQILQAYIDHRLEVVTRRTTFDLAKAKKRAHILEGLQVAVEHIQELIDMIKASRTKEDTAGQLRERFKLSKKQIQAILDMRLHQLTGLARDQLHAEYQKIKEQMTFFQELLDHQDQRINMVKEELLEIQEKYAIPRRTEIRSVGNEIHLEDLIKRTICAITLSKAGYIIRLPIETFRLQRRGGKGIKAMGTKDGDYVHQLFTACTHDYMLFFSNKGLMHWSKVYEIPEGQRTNKGKAIVNLFQLTSEEKMRSLLTVENVDVENQYLIFSTRLGLVKKTLLSAFKNLRHKAIRSIKLREEDDLVDVRLSDGEKQIMLFTKFGMACRFKEDQVRSTGRASQGIIGVRLKEKDAVIALIVVEEKADILIVTEKGMGKRSNIGIGIAEEDKATGGGYRLTNRGGKGVIAIRLKKDDKVVGILPITMDDELMITTEKGQLVRTNINDIRSIGRSSRGVRIINLREGDRVTDVSLIQKMEEETEEQMDTDTNDSQQ